MDKFVIKTARKPPVSIPSAVPQSYKQVKITSLPGVVVVEEITKAKKVLTSDSTSRRQKIDTLLDLSEKRPTKKFLKSTGLGNVVEKLKKSSDAEIAKLAKKILRSWKNYIAHKEKLTPLEVKCDLKTEQFREKARNLLMTAVNPKKENIPNLKELIVAIERELFEKCKRKTLYGYRRTIRKLVFALRHQDDLKQEFLGNSLTAAEIVNKFYQP